MVYIQQAMNSLLERRKRHPDHYPRTVKPRKEEPTFQRISLPLVLNWRIQAQKQGGRFLIWFLFAWAIFTPNYYTVSDDYCQTSLEINKLLFNAILTFPQVAL